MNEFIKIFCTVPASDVAEMISNALVTEKLVACVNILPGLTSFYRWKGEICKDSELLLLMKSKKDLFHDISKRIKELHPYEIPEIVALPIIAGNDPYLKWIDESIK